MPSLGATAFYADPSEEQEDAIPNIAKLYNSNSAAALQPIAKAMTKVIKRKFIAR